MTGRHRGRATATAAVLAGLIAGCAAPDGDGGKRNIIGPVFFACNDGTLLTVRFDEDNNTAWVVGRRGLSEILHQTRSASGYWSADARYILRGEGRDASWQAPGRAPTQCRDRGSR